MSLFGQVCSFQTLRVHMFHNPDYDAYSKLCKFQLVYIPPLVQSGIVASAFKSTIVLFCAFFSVACFF